MTWKLIRFGRFTLDSRTMVTLPILERTHEMGSGASRLLLLDSPDGQIDLLGDDRAMRGPLTLSYNCKLFSATSQGLQTELDVLKGMRGKRDKLWMELYNGDLRWMWARLDSVTGNNNPRTGLYFPLTITFSIQSQWWNGGWHENWVLDDDKFLDSALYLESGMVFALNSSTTMTYAINFGNVTINDCIIIVTAQTTDITNLVIKRKTTVSQITMEHLVYTGTILAGTSLVIDCGAGSVKNNGVGDSAHFSRGADHKYDGWLRIDPDTFSLIYITRTGGGVTSTVEYKFSDGWE